MQGYPFDTFGTKHLLYLGGVALGCVVVLTTGVRRLSLRQQRMVAIALAVFGLGQELTDDLVRVHYGVWSVQEALPLHLCSLGMLVSVWALLTKRQLVFELAYFWGFAAATQALLTPDNSRWQLAEFDVLWNFLSHGAIILNVSWLLVVDRMRCREWAWLRVFLLTNLMLVPVGLINLLLGANYFFICRKPGGVSPFLMGEWPWYILGFEAFGLLFFLILSIPMWWVKRRERETG